jgi:hypothetical protein
MPYLWLRLAVSMLMHGLSALSPRVPMLSGCMNNERWCSARMRGVPRRALAILTRGVFGEDQESWRATSSSGH